MSSPCCPLHCPNKELWPSVSTLEWLDNIATHASSLFKSGNLVDAKDGFICGENLINTVAPDELSPDDRQNFFIEARTHVAMIQIYLIIDSHGSNDFNDPNNMDDIDEEIKKKLDEVVTTYKSTKARLVIDIARSYSSSLTARGKFESAAQVLLDTINLLEVMVLDRTYDPEIQVRRDLVVLYGYMGNNQGALQEISTADNLVRSKLSLCNISADQDTAEVLKAIEDMSPTVDEDHSKDIRQLLHEKETVRYASAIIDFLWGMDYPTCLRKLDRAYRGLGATLGAEHPETIAAAGLRGLLLAYNGRFHEAEIECSKASDSMVKLFGEFDEKTIEVQGFMVEILNMQSKFLEASRLGKSLDDKLDAWSLNNEFLQMRVQSQLGNLNLLGGNYDCAIYHLRFAGDIAHVCHDPNHPDLLHYQSQLSRAYFEIGERDEAERCATDALWGQLEYYTPELLRGKEDGDPSVLVELIQNTNMNQNRNRIHPRILSTLENIGLIEQKMGSFDEGTVRQIFIFVLFEKIHLFGQRHISTISSAYDLGKLLVSSKETRMSCSLAKFWFTFAYIQFMLLLGPDHVRTISAKRELIYANFYLLKWQNFDDQFMAQALREFENSDLVSQVLRLPEDQIEDTKIIARLLSEGDLLTENKLAEAGRIYTDIVHSHELVLGDCHPETLESVFKLFSVHIGEGDVAKIKETSKSLLKRTLDEEFKAQALLEHYHWHIVVADMLRKNGYIESAIEILRGMQQDESLRDDRELLWIPAWMEKTRSELLAQCESDFSVTAQGWWLTIQYRIEPQWPHGYCENLLSHGKTGLLNIRL
ncbi:hypothetical protein F4810DRAFT_693518 [Camillea tinctor]|nr:hypothetical protein F4810DRAFT_693518 [Camillea tinctor]